MIASYSERLLHFKQPIKTSRGGMSSKWSYYILLKRGEDFGVGECSLIGGLSTDYAEDYEKVLQKLVHSLSNGSPIPNLIKYPSIQAGLEMAYISLKSKSIKSVPRHAFTDGYRDIEINGLVWMGSKEYMQSQIDSLLKSNYRCIKMKIGAIDFDIERSLLHYIRERFDGEDITIRVDANGAYDRTEALNKIEALSEYDIHSIEQPLRIGDLDGLARLCELSPIPIALDEDLFLTAKRTEKCDFLKLIRPHYIVLKPSLIGGFSEAEEWIEVANSLGIGWWVTSALESNVGLNAIAFWLSKYKTEMEQGLGTGGLFTNNIKAPLSITDGKLSIDVDGEWEPINTFVSSIES